MSKKEVNSDFKNIIKVINHQLKDKFYTKTIETTPDSRVVIFEKDFSHNDDDGEYIDFGNIIIKIAFNKGEHNKGTDTHGGSRKRIIKRKKTTRRNRKTKK
jgi:hypothetical protein